MHRVRRLSVAVQPNWNYQPKNTRYKTSSATEYDDYQYLQMSLLPTMHFQSSLLRLPIPKLENTCERYLNALRPILNNETYKNSQDVVDNFRLNEGPQLQKILIDQDNEMKHTSYICKPWFDMYLKDRSPLPLNYNPLLVMKHDTRPEYNNQLVRATNLVISALRFRNSLRNNLLEPEIFHLNPTKSDTKTFRKIMKIIPKSIATYSAYAFKAYPLDMSQYNGLFGASRIPEKDKDRIYRSDNTKHLLVMRRGHFFLVDVLDNNGNIESPNVIMGRLSAVLNQNLEKTDCPLGLLTTANRNDWANIREHLIKIGNEEQIKLIDSALFCLCLDDDIPYDESNPIPLVKHFLIGDGVNRWFDKSVSLFVEKDGTAAINFEHSWGDGVAVLRFFNEIYAESIKSPFVHPNSIPYTSNAQSAIKKLEFQCNDYLKDNLIKINEEHNSVVNNLDMHMVRYKDINKIICKKIGVSPDSIMQLSFQLAYYQIFNDYVGSYESCSTAAFRHGRTETMRPCTMATKTFCDSILKRNPPTASELLSMIKDCSIVHGNLTKEAAMGQGFDRHLFGLKHMAEINEMKIPSLYEDAGYKKINYNIISTSTLSSPALLAGAFGPVVSNGFGIGYSIQNDECGAIIATNKVQSDGGAFAESLHEAFNKIRNVINNKM